MIEQALATYRLVRLARQDTITAPIRERFYLWALTPRDGRAAHPKAAELLDCPWCLSVWAAATVLCLRYVPGGRAVVRVLALSAAAGLLHRTVEVSESFSGPDPVGTFAGRTTGRVG